MDVDPSMPHGAPEAASAPEATPRPFARWLTIVGTLVVAGVFAAGIWVRRDAANDTGAPGAGVPGAGVAARAQGSDEPVEARHPALRVVDTGGAAVGLLAAGILFALRRRARPPAPVLAAPWPRGELYAGIVRCLFWSFLLVMVAALAMVALKHPPDTAALTLVLYALGFAFMVRLVFRRWGLSWRDGFARPPAGAARDVVLTTLAAIGLCRAGSLCIGLLGSLTGGRLTSADLPEPIAAASGIDVALAIAGAVVMPALTEELLFRRAVFTRLRRSLAPGTAALASALVFALPHGYSPLGLAMLTWMGLVTAWALHRTGSLWPCLGAHAFSNAIAVWASVR
jgi:membrane protease YdiL (CAAX protease family)